MDVTNPAIDRYNEALADFVRTRSEKALFVASLVSQEFVESGLGPDDIIGIHFEALDQSLASLSPVEQVRAVGDAHQFLLEVMIAYGIKYREYLDLKLRETLRDAEARTEIERQRAVELEEVAQQKAEILAMIAHELRTPLTVAQGQIDLAIRSLDNGQLERVPRLLGSTREAIERLSRLTADLVQISRNEPTYLECEARDLNLIVRQAYSWARPSAMAKGVTLIWEERESSLWATCNDDALLSVIGNLLSNAIRYTYSGGTVTITQGVLDDMAWIEVADTGVGMTPEVQARIFEKFYRGPEARTLDVQGLGLGLALVQQLVEAQRGRIEVESSPGHGSRFRTLVPVVTEHGKEQADGGDQGG